MLLSLEPVGLLLFDARSQSRSFFGHGETRRQLRLTAGLQSPLTRRESLNAYFPNNFPCHIDPFECERGPSVASASGLLESMYDPD